MMFLEERKQLCKVVKLMYDRKFTNTAGGNISVKMNDDLYIMTPSFMSQKFHCELKPEQILVINSDENIVEGNGTITREINMHMACYKSNPQIGTVVHAHPLKSMFFAVAGLDMPNITEASHKLGEIKCLPFAPATTKELANIVEKELENKISIPKSYLLNKHGVLVLGDKLEKTYDLLERLEWNAEVAYKYMLFEKLGINMELVDIGNYNILE